VIGIDVLAFPPDAAALEDMRISELDESTELARRARVATFLGVGLMLAWVADVAAVFQHASGSPAPWGFLSLVLATLIVFAHIVGRHLLGRSERVRRRIEQRYSPVRLQHAGALLQLARQNVIVSQYLRMVGRQQRPLRQLESEALQRWAEAAHIG
jgi:hypothetical protein